MRRILALVLLAAGVSGMSGCASSQPEDPNQVSTIPWARPERWEGQGPLGSMMGGGGGR